MDSFDTYNCICYINISFLWLLSTSLKGAGENIFAYPPAIIPKDFTWANYVGVWHKVDLMRYFINSMIVAGGTVFT